MLYHVSLIRHNYNRFTPRIPESRSRKTRENDTIKRICLSSNIEGCLTAIPERGLEYFADQESRGVPFLLYLYSIDESSIEKSNIINPEKLLEKQYVFDAKVTNEHWIINQDIVFDEPKLLRVVNLDEEKITIPTFTEETFDIYTITDLGLESSVEPYGRAYEYHVATKEDLDKLKSIISQTGCKIVNKGTFCENFYYSLNFFVPLGIDIKLVWEEYFKIRIDYLNKFDSQDFYETGLWRSNICLVITIVVYHIVAI